MGIGFWIKRASLVFSITFSLLVASQMLLKGAQFTAALSYALLWGGIATAVFIASRLYQARKGQHCALCNDIPQADISKSDHHTNTPADPTR